jgi:hypothetical protein
MPSDGASKVLEGKAQAKFADVALGVMSCNGWSIIAITAKKFLRALDTIGEGLDKKRRF